MLLHAEVKKKVPCLSPRIALLGDLSALHCLHCRASWLPSYSQGICCCGHWLLDDDYSITGSSISNSQRPDTQYFPPQTLHSLNLHRSYLLERTTRIPHIRGKRALRPICIFVAITFPPASQHLEAQTWDTVRDFHLTGTPHDASCKLLHLQIARVRGSFLLRGVPSWTDTESAECRPSL